MMITATTATTEPRSFRQDLEPDDHPSQDSVYIHLPEVEIAAEVPQGARLLGRAKPALKMDQELQEANRIYMVFADDQPWESYWEDIQLNLQPRNMGMDRLKAGLVSLVLSHSYSYDNALGRIEAVWLHDHKLYAEAVFSNNDRPQQVLQDVRDGIVRGVSIGAESRKYKWVREPSDGDRGLVEAVEWVLMEITVTTAPANPRVGIMASMGAALRADLENFRKEQADMVTATITADAADPAAPDNNQPAQSNAQDTPPATPAPGQPAPDNAQVQATAAQSEESARVAALLDLAKRGHDKEKIFAAIEAGTSELEFLRGDGAPDDTPSDQRQVNAQAKPNATPADFNLDLLLRASINRMDTDSQEAAYPSRRAIEIIHAARGSDAPRIGPQAGGMMVPEELLVAEHNRLEQAYARQLVRAGIQPRSMIRAAVTTSTTATGLIDEQLLAMDFIDLLLEEASILPYCDVRRGVDQPFAFPYTVSAADAAASAENPAAALTPGTFQVGTRQLAPKRLTTYFEYTPESEVQSRGLTGTYGMLEAVRLMRDQCENDIWNGTNADGQVNGIITGLAAARKTTYVTADGITVANLRSLKRKMNKEHMPMMGRLWVVSPEMMEWLDLQAQVASVSELVRGEGGMMSMFGAPIQETTHPAVPANSATYGIAFHMYPRSLTVAFFGQDIEVILDRKSGDVAGAANFQVLLLKLWQIMPKRPEFLQMFLDD